MTMPRRMVIISVTYKAMTKKTIAVHCEFCDVVYTGHVDHDYMVRPVDSEGNEMMIKFDNIIHVSHRCN